MFWALLMLAAAQSLPSDRQPFQDVLADAKQRMYDGDYDEAGALLQGLSDRLFQGEHPPQALALDALITLGDAQVVNGSVEAARSTFRRVLEIDRDTILSPYHHGDDVRAVFALEKEDYNRARPIPGFVRPPPLLKPIDFMPFGAPQRRLGDRRAANRWATVHGALAVGSLSSFVLLTVVNRDPEKGPWTAEKVNRNVPRLRYVMQWPLTIGFYGAWTASVLDARKRRIERSATER